MRRITPLLVLVLACAAGCQQVLGLDDYKPEGEGAGDDATLLPSPEGAADTAPVDRTTGGDAPGGDATTGLDDASWDSVAPDGSDAAVVSGSDAGESGEEDAFPSPDSADGSSPDGVDSAEAEAEAAASDAPGAADDSAPSSGCPQETPPGVTRCCAHVPCVARSGNACNCGACMQQGCSSVCCFGSQGNASCVPTPADCR